MSLEQPEKTEIKDKVNLMITDGIILEIPVDTHISKLEKTIEHFSKIDYVMKEKTTINHINCRPAAGVTQFRSQSNY